MWCLVSFIVLICWPPQCHHFGVTLVRIPRGLEMDTQADYLWTSDPICPIIVVSAAHTSLYILKGQNPHTMFQHKGPRNLKACEKHMYIYLGSGPFHSLFCMVRCRGARRYLLAYRPGVAVRPRVKKLVFLASVPRSTCFSVIRPTALRPHDITVLWVSYGAETDDLHVL